MRRSESGAAGLLRGAGAGNEHCNALMAAAWPGVCSNEPSTYFLFSVNRIEIRTTLGRTSRMMKTSLISCSAGAGRSASIVPVYTLVKNRHRASLAARKVLGQSSLRTSAYIKPSSLSVS